MHLIGFSFFLINVVLKAEFHWNLEGTCYFSYLKESASTNIFHRRNSTPLEAHGKQIKYSAGRYASLQTGHAQFLLTCKRNESTWLVIEEITSATETEIWFQVLIRQ